MVEYQNVYAVVEERVGKFWESNNIVSKIKSARKGAKKFYLLDGPPYINDVPHVGTLKTTTAKDVWSKLKLMQGFDVWLQPGFDCHGLPVETKVEQELGIKSKDDIERMGKDKFIAACMSKVVGNEKFGMDVYRKFGAWRGWFEPYMTYNNYYIESGWWTIKRLHERGQLVQGIKPIFWCARCGTALSGYEVTDSYRDLKDPGIYVKFKVVGKPEYLLVYTTTPWTLPGNVAIAVHPSETYARVKVGNEILIVAEKRIKPVFEETVKVKYEVLERFKGETLDGLRYEPVLDVPAQKGIEHKVILSIPIMKYKKYKKHKLKRSEDKPEEEKEEFGEFVTMDEGSGLVHTAPGHGSTDFEIGKYYNLPSISPVDDRGQFTSGGGKYCGMFVKDADAKIIEDLEKANKLLWHGTIVHSYPVCWRCKNPLIYRASQQWFLKVEPIKDKMIEANEKVRWMPAFAQKRFHNWLIDAIDWCVSQQRYWGIPLPVWVCAKCGKKIVVESAEQLRKWSIEPLPEELDLHRHVVDNIKFKCSCGDLMSRVPDTLNVWFDSGIAPWASLGYPFRNKETFEWLWPVDMIDEAQDQIRGWFYSLMFCGMSVFDRSPYESVGMLGWVLDEKGEKMSKSLGNVIWAKDALEMLGADALRLYYCWETPMWETQNFSFKTAEEVRRALNVLWNSYAFLETYAAASKWKPGRPGKLNVEDRWILSRLNTLIMKVTGQMENFEFHLAGRSITNFITEELSRWYIKLIRDRTWPTYKGKDKAAAFNTLYIVLREISKLLAPICPFITEDAWQRLFKNEAESVHMCKWPSANEKLLDTDLEKQMSVIQAIVEAACAARADAGIGLRYPLNAITITGNKQVLKATRSMKQIIAD
ncbi:MAG: isoleucine--tRNA ligase, partial [Candidatus Aenigmatarchaeota archaeon]